QARTTESFGFAVSGTVSSVAIDPNQWILDLPASAAVRDNTLLGSRSAAGVAPLTLYPNPCHDQLRLAALPAAQVTAEVLDATGRLVRRQMVQAAAPQLDTRALAPGLYHLQLLGPARELLGQGRFVRE
ncbi:MAG TPA: T9SS type A sorting domain-containing protein, partial [Hymenobacter sp.]